MARLWWTSVFLAASALITVSAAEGTVVINGCQNGTTTLFERDSLYLYCYDLTNDDGVFHWTLRTENGTEVPLGTCHEVNNCTSSLKTTDRLRRLSSSWSELSLYGVISMSGDITCTVRTKSIVRTDTCRLNVDRVKVYRDVMNLLDGNKLYIQLPLSTASRSRITVTVTGESGNIIVLGVCIKGQSTCTSLTDKIQVYDGTSYMRISSQTELERRLAGRVSVSVSFESKPETAQFTINMYSHPSADNCSIDVQHHNWTAVLSCDVSHAFSSAGIYGFRLLEFTPYIFINKNHYDFRTTNSSSELKRHEERSFLPNMHSYFNTTNNKTYYGGRLQYSWRLSPNFKLASIILRTSTSQYDYMFPTPWFIRMPNVDGPDKVNVRVYLNTNTSRLTAECQVRGLNPRTPDMVQWEGPCQGQQGFTCTLDPGQTGLSGKTVTCRVTNSANNGHSASADKVIDTDFNMDPSGSDSDSDRMKWSAIGGGVMLAVVVVVTLLAVVVICICRRGHLCFAPQPGGTQVTSTTDQHHYETLESSQAKTAGAGGPPQTADRDSSAYENSGYSGVAENRM